VMLLSIIEFVRGLTKIDSVGMIGDSFSV
jgi:hypothetical protein